MSRLILTTAPKAPKAPKVPKVPKPPKETKPRAPKVEKPVTLSIPDKVEGIDRWLIFGLDPSLSRTGFAVMLVTPGGDRTVAKWLDVGSMKPDEAGDAVWIRSKAVALSLRDELGIVIDAHLAGEDLSSTGLIISFEAPTPNNDFLTSISRILHLILLELGSPTDLFGRVQVQMTNAATLRRLMGLVQKGASNKTENVARAYTFLDQGSYPNLDTDACDAVLMGMMARYSAAILMGFPHTIPERFLIALTNGETEVVGKGRNAKTRTKGIMHRREYWTLYTRKEYAVLLRALKLVMLATQAEIKFRNFVSIIEVAVSVWVLPNMSAWNSITLFTARPDRSAPLSILVHFIMTTLRLALAASVPSAVTNFDLVLQFEIRGIVREVGGMRRLASSVTDRQLMRRYDNPPRGPPGGAKSRADSTPKLRQLPRFYAYFEYVRTKSPGNCR